MQLTPEQSDIISHIKSNDGLTMVSAVAGSGKTTLLTELAKATNCTNGLYLAYNKAIATDAKKRFPSSVHCSTTHSLAYGPTVREKKLKLGRFSYRQLPNTLIYEEKVEFIDYFKQFCLSSYLSFSDFATYHDLPSSYTALGNSFLSQMESGAIECTHDFYLKLFHMQLAHGEIEYDPFDLIMLDEAGDLNEVTLEIFKLLPSAKKVMVGDPYQNIYTFNHTINCFEVMQDQGHLMPMSQSFRVADHIAERIEQFCQSYLNPDMRFEGIPLRDTTINSRAFIARTNSYLIAHMMELNAQSIPYGLTRKADQIFDLPLLVCSFRYQGFIKNPEFKHLQADIDHYVEHMRELKPTYPTLNAYLLDTHSDDISLTNAIKLIQRYSKSEILACHREAKRHEKANQSYMLGTAHSMKGLEADEVTLAPDMNEAISDLITHKRVKPDLKFDISAIAELNLYYVAISRSRKSLINAIHL